MLQTDSVLNLPGDVRMLDAVRAGLANATDVRIAVAFTRCSGLGLLLDPLREVTARNGSVRLLTSTYQAITQPEALDALLANPGLETRVQHGGTAFHAKFWWFDGASGAVCWAGSSNLTKGGLATNLEWNLRRVDAPAIAETKAQFERLWARPDVQPLTAPLIEWYRRERRVETPPRPLVLRAAERPLPVPNAAQREALAQLAALRARGERRAAIIAATGVGKTFLAAFDVAQAGARSVL